MCGFPSGTSCVVVLRGVDLDTDGNEMKCHLFCMQAKSTVNERIRWSMCEGRALVLINNLKIPRQVRVRAACKKQLFEA